MSAARAVLSLLAGLTLGVCFYGGLWFTVQRLATSTHPVLLTVASFWLRLLAVLAVFVLLAKQGLASVAIAMAGFILGRLAVSRFVPDRRTRCT